MYGTTYDYRSPGTTEDGGAHRTLDTFTYYTSSECHTVASLEVMPSGGYMVGYLRKHGDGKAHTRGSPPLLWVGVQVKNWAVDRGPLEEQGLWVTDHNAWYRLETASGEYEACFSAIRKRADFALSIWNCLARDGDGSLSEVLARLNAAQSPSRTIDVPTIARHWHFLEQHALNPAHDRFATTAAAAVTAYNKQQRAALTCGPAKSVARPRAQRPPLLPAAKEPAAGKKLPTKLAKGGRNSTTVPDDDGGWPEVKNSVPGALPSAPRWKRIAPAPVNAGKKPEMGLHNACGRVEAAKERRQEETKRAPRNGSSSNKSSNSGNSDEGNPVARARARKRRISAATESRTTKKGRRAALAKGTREEPVNILLLDKSDDSDENDDVVLSELKARKMRRQALQSAKNAPQSKGNASRKAPRSTERTVHPEERTVQPRERMVQPAERTAQSKARAPQRKDKALQSTGNGAAAQKKRLPAAAAPRKAAGTAKAAKAAARSRVSAAQGGPAKVRGGGAKCEKAKAPPIDRGGGLVVPRKSRARGGNAPFFAGGAAAPAAARRAGERTRDPRLAMRTGRYASRAKAHEVERAEDPNRAIFDANVAPAYNPYAVKGRKVIHRSTTSVESIKEERRRALAEAMAIKEAAKSASGAASSETLSEHSAMSNSSSSSSSKSVLDDPEAKDSASSISSGSYDLSTDTSRPGASRGPPASFSATKAPGLSAWPEPKPQGAGPPQEIAVRHVLLRDYRAGRAPPLRRVSESFDADDEAASERSDDLSDLEEDLSAPAGGADSDGSDLSELGSIEGDADSDLSEIDEIDTAEDIVAVAPPIGAVRERAPESIVVQAPSEEEYSDLGV